MASNTVEGNTIAPSGVMGSITTGLSNICASNINSYIEENPIVRTTVNTIAEINGKLTTHISDFKNTKIDLTHALDKNNMRLTNIENNMNKIETSMKDLKTELKTDLGNRMDKIETNLGNRMDKIETSMKELKTDLGNRMDKIETNLGNRMDKIETNMDGLKNEMSNRMDKIETNLGNRMDKIETNMDGLKNEMSEIKGLLHQVLGQINYRKRSHSRDRNQERGYSGKRGRGNGGYKRNRTVHMNEN